MTDSSIKMSKLKNGSKLLIYYLRMYLDSYDWLTEQSQIPPGWDFQYNAVLEAHLIFTRLLIEFVTRKVKGKDDDVFAAMYFADAGSSPFPKNSALLKGHMKRISKISAHITVVDYPNFEIKSCQSFEIYVIAAELKPLLKEFFDKVAPGKVDGGIQEAAQHLLSQSSLLGSVRSISPST